MQGTQKVTPKNQIFIPPPPLTEWQMVQKLAVFRPPPPSGEWNTFCIAPMHGVPVRGLAAICSVDQKFRWTPVVLMITGSSFGTFCCLHDEWNEIEIHPIHQSSRNYDPNPIHSSKNLWIHPRCRSVEILVILVFGSIFIKKCVKTIWRPKLLISEDAFHWSEKIFLSSGWRKEVGRKYEIGNIHSVFYRTNSLVSQPKQMAVRASFSLEGVSLDEDLRSCSGCSN